MLRLRLSLYLHSVICSPAGAIHKHISLLSTQKVENGGHENDFMKPIKQTEEMSQNHNIKSPETAWEHHRSESPYQKSVRDITRLKRFKLKNNRLLNPNFWLQVINTPHSMPETLKILKTIQSSFSKSQLESIYKKYVYYLEDMHQQDKFMSSPAPQKIAYLQLVTSIYDKLGKVSSPALLKMFNKVSHVILHQLRHSAQDQSLCDYLQVLVCISRYNIGKARAFYHKFEEHHKHYTEVDTLSRISSLKAISQFLELFQNIKIYNRLIIELAADLYFDHLDSLNIEQINFILMVLSASRYPVNKQIVGALAHRFDKIYNSLNKPSPSVLLLKRQINILSSLSAIQENMKLASAYLPALDRVYEASTLSLLSSIECLPSQYLAKMSNYLRRSAYYDESCLLSIMSECMNRQVEELHRQVEEFHRQTQGQTFSAARTRTITLNALCSVLHMFAVMDYRCQKFVDYLVAAFEIFGEKIEEAIENKHYSRVVWSLCVFYHKSVSKKYLKVISLIFEVYFRQGQRQSASTSSWGKPHEMVNFYYCYLLLRSRLPQLSRYVRQMEGCLGQGSAGEGVAVELISKISQTHQKICNELIAAGIPCLKEFQICNLMCDILIPSHVVLVRSSSRRYQLSNLVIDVHGFHHFMRNCGQVKGGTKLKASILHQQGYIYQYIGIDQWQLAAGDRRGFIDTIMESMAVHYGKELPNADPIKIPQKSVLSSSTSSDTQRISATHSSNEQASVSGIRGRKVRRVKTY